jgi:hypothetical protein
MSRLDGSGLPINPPLVRNAAALTLGELARRIAAGHEATEASLTEAVVHARDVGLDLEQVKAQLPHGSFLPWVKAHCPFTHDRANTYMKVARRWGELANSVRARNLTSLRQAFELLRTLDDEDLPPVARDALQHGLISPAAARRLGELAVFDRVATVTVHEALGLPEEAFIKYPPTGETKTVRPHPDSWADHFCKLILWRPGFARTDDKVSSQVDSSLFDLDYLEDEYATLDADQADDKARGLVADFAAGGKDRPEGAGFIHEDLWWARLWLDLRPDFTNLSDADRDLIDQATERYLQPQAANGRGS